MPRGTEYTAGVEPFPLPPRAALRAHAERLPETPLTLVSAPAGSGKSGLLSAWQAELAARGVPVARVDLARWHADAASLCADLVDALAAALGGFGPETRALAGRIPDSAREWPLLARSLLREWSAAQRHAIVMLEDWNVLAPASSGLALADELLARAPTSLRFVVTTRGAEPAAAARLRATDRLLDVGAEDLALRIDEIRDTLASRGVAPDAELATRLLAQSEGWATGVMLAARLLSRAPPEDRHSLVSRLAHEPDVFAYVAGEVLRDEPAERVALLECASLLGVSTSRALAEASGVPDAQRRSAEACARGLLLRDGEKVWLPALWRGLLRERVVARTDDDAVALRRRVARTLTGAGRDEEALDLLAEARDWDELGRALVARGTDLAIAGRRQSLIDRLELLPADHVGASPDLLLLHGGALVGRDDTRARRLLEQARASYAGRSAWEPRASATGLLVMLHLTRGRVAEARATIRSLVRLRDVASKPSVRGGLVVALAGAAFLAQRFERARALCERALRFPLTAPNRWLASMGSAFVHLLRGEWERARGLAESALSEAELSRIPIFHETLRVVRAVALARSGHAEAALPDAENALEILRGLRVERTTLVAELMASDVWISAGRIDAAVEMLASAAAQLERAGHTALEAPCRAQLSFLRFVAGDAAGARADAQRADTAFLHAVEERTRLFAWSWLRALWVLAETGDAAASDARARAHARLFAPRDLPLVEHGAAMLRAEIARRAGRTAEADALAREAWKGAADAHLLARDEILSRALGSWTAARALALGVDPDYVVDRMRTLHARDLPGILVDLAGHGTAPVRRMAVTQMGRLGDRIFHGALLTAERDGDRRVREAAVRARALLDPAPRYVLRIDTLGRWRVRRGDDEIGDREWRGQTTRRLLLRLLVAGGRPVARDALLEDLWPDADPDDARGHLRVAVSRLLGALEPDRPEGAAPTFVVATAEGDGLVLPRRDAVRWDAEAWEAESAASLREGLAPADALPLLREAFAHWDGRFAPGLPGDPWLEPLRRRLEDRWCAVGHGLAGRLTDVGQVEEAASVLDRLLARDSTDERAWASRVRLALRRGDRAGALRLLAAARERFQAVLGMPPGPELAALESEARER